MGLNNKILQRYEMKEKLVYSMVMKHYILVVATCAWCCGGTPVGMRRL